jgi:hypothetical protein
MIEPSLAGCWAKLERAQTHIDALHTEMVGIRQQIADGVVFAAEYEAHLQAVHIRVASAPEIPFHWSLLIGDAVHNLRCALDYVAYKLVALNNYETPVRLTQFPIVDRPEDLAKATKTFTRLTPGQRACVEWHQPYSNPLNSPLATLRDVSNADKHRAVLDRFLIPAPDASLRVWPRQDCTDITPFDYWPRSLKPGAYLARFNIRITGPNPEVDVEFDLPPWIAGGEIAGDIEGELDLMALKVVQVVREFEPFF